MSKFMRWLRSFGVAGTALANVLAFLTANWGLVVSAVSGLIVALWATALGFFQKPSVQIGIGVFLAVLWTLIGIVVLWDRRKPRIVRPYQDYRYGLTFEGLIPNLDPKNEEAALQFGIQLRNYSMGPILYNIEHFDVRIGSRALPKYKREKSGTYLPRGSAKVSTAVPFNKADIQEFFGKKVTGTADFAIIYGHPEDPPVRRLKMVMDLILIFKEGGEPPLGFSGNIIEENDEPFTR